MNDLIVIIYFIDFLAQIKTIASVVIGIFSCFLLIGFAMHLIIGNDLSDYMKTKAPVMFNFGSVFLIVSVVLWVLIPKQNSMYVMTGLYTAQKVVVWSDSKIAEQALNTLNAKLAEIEAESKQKIKEISEKSDDKDQK
ncbi:hypothetical protein [Faucicola boevrei]|uniref:hypothetical protein n=1 Tax=Faucicola boevrei TaxID=346665 RepID=UPI00036985D8|nr:hypothetical protein [Moraxella boevrei]